MSCNKPIPAWQTSDGLAFSPPKDGSGIPIEIACGYCTQCRIDKSRERAIRCVHEASMFNKNCFVTLTFDNEHLPEDKNLDWEIFKKFMKKLRERQFRKHGEKVRYYAAGS